MASNVIRDVTFRPVAEARDADEGDGSATSDGAHRSHALFFALDIGDPGALAGFLEGVVARFIAACSDGPPVHYMLITVVGEVSALDFVREWRAATAHNAPARALLGMLQQADVMQGDSPTRLTGHASLLVAPPDSCDSQRS